MINLTPHAIVLRRENGTEVTFPPSGKLARVASSEVTVGEYEGIPIVTRKFGEPEGLPEEGELCLVSALVLGTVPGRKGVYAPDSGPSAIRENGQIVAVTRLVAA